MKKSTRKWVISLTVLLLIALIASVGLMMLAQKQNRVADITEYTVTKETLPKELDGMCIAHVSDYHGDSTCRAQIVDSLRETAPEIIVITGDLLDPEVEEESLSFAAELVSIAPTYFSTGNHESRLNNYPEMEMRLRSSGVKVLRNEVVSFEKEGASVRIAGADDETMQTEVDYAALCADEDFTILLSHRPEHFEEYVDAGAELVFSGHAHGGQFRIPGTGQGIIAHGQEIVPKYTQGVHEKDGTTMVVSRGIANTYFPPRLFNPPELVYVTLYCTEQE